MTRRTWLALPVFLLGCGVSDSEQPFTPPATLADAGTLEGFEEIAPDSVPEEIRAMGVAGAYTARYSGSQSVTAKFYRMNASASAFELMQKWRPVEGKLASYSGTWFVVIESPGADNATLSSIASAIEAELYE